jgi:hypothetical protein
MIPVHLRGERTGDGKRCPHGDVKFCPLYHAAHEATGGLNCLDLEANGWNGCAVDRGKLKYDQVYAGLAIAFPRIVAECEWVEAKELRGRQIDRNIRLNGIH